MISQASSREQAPVPKRKHAWVMSYLYIGTFGSFIGCSASFLILVTSQFSECSSIYLAAFGSIVGSLARPIGGCFRIRPGVLA